MRGGEGGEKPSGESLTWDELMAFGLGAMRLSPAAFWTMTLKELAAATRGMAPQREAIGRERLEAMMQAFPD